MVSVNKIPVVEQPGTDDLLDERHGAARHDDIVFDDVQMGRAVQVHPQQHVVRHQAAKLTVRQPMPGQPVRVAIHRRKAVIARHRIEPRELRFHFGAAFGTTVEVDVTSNIRHASPHGPAKDTPCLVAVAYRKPVRKRRNRPSGDHRVTAAPGLLDVPATSLALSLYKRQERSPSPASAAGDGFKILIHELAGPGRRRHRMDWRIGVLDDLDRYAVRRRHTGRLHRLRCDRGQRVHRHCGGGMDPGRHSGHRLCGAAARRRGRPAARRRCRRSCCATSARPFQTEPSDLSTPAPAPQGSLFVSLPACGGGPGRGAVRHGPSQAVRVMF